MAGTIKGMTIEIGGNTAPLEQALKDTNKEIKSTQNELKEVNKLLKLDPTNTELLKQKQQLLGDQIKNTTTKLDALKQAQAQLDAEMKKGGNVNQEEYRKLEREISVAESSLKKLKDEAKNTHPELAKVKEALAKAGEIAGNVTQKFVDFTVKGVQVMAKACTVAVTSVGALAVKAGQLADDLNTLASTTGLSTKQLQEFQYASELIDVSVDTLAGALKKTTSSMASAQDGTGATAEAFKKLGVSVTNADGSLRNNNDVFNETIRALASVGNETERDALAMQIFGKSATELNPLIEGGIDTLEQMSKQANELGLVLSQEALDGANAFNDQLDILKANGQKTFQVIGTEIAGQLAPAMEKVNEYTMEVIKSLTSAMETGGIEGLVEELSNQVGDMLSKAMEKLPEVAELGVSMIQKLLEGIKKNASQVGGAGANLITTLVEGFFTVLPDVVSTAIEIVASFGRTLAENLPDLIPVAIQGLLDTLQSIIDNIPMIIETVVDIIVAIVEALTDPDNIIMIIDGAVELIIGLAEGLIKALPKLIERLPEIMEAIVVGLIVLLYKLNEVAENLMQTLSNYFSEKVDMLKEGLYNIWTYIKDTLTEKVKGIVDVGKNIVTGIWEGIKNAKDWLMNKLKEWCDNIIGGIKGFFGIESPSKVMADEVGKYMAEGVGMGFNATLPAVASAMQDKLAQVTEAMQTELAFGDIPQIEGNQIISENSYVTRNYTNTIETVRQPQTVELVLDGTKLARAIIQPLDNEYNRLGVKV